MGEVACSPVCVFADTDQIIEERYGKSCGEVFTELGEKAFRDVEEDVVAEALASYGGILALGGGAILSPRTRTLLMDVPVIFLDISAAEGIRRTSGTATRPVLAAADPVEHYRQLYRIRRPYYFEVADLVLQPEHRKPIDVIDEICTFLGRTRITTNSDN